MEDNMRQRRFILGLLFLMVVSPASWASADIVTLPNPDPLITGQNGDFYAYSYPILEAFGLITRHPTSLYFWDSSPGKIFNDLVIYTGVTGGDVTGANVIDNNIRYNTTLGYTFLCSSASGGQNDLNNCVDKSFQAPNASATFDMTSSNEPPNDSPDNPNPWGPQDVQGTWDIKLAKLIEYLTLDNVFFHPVFQLNQNEENANNATDQDMWGWGIVKITGANVPTIYYEFAGPTRTPNTVPPWNDPTDGNDGYVSDGLLNGGDPNLLDNGSWGGPNNPGEFVFGAGQVCLDAVGNNVPCNDPTKVFGPFNHNLGANEFAYGIVSFDLNAFLDKCKAGDAACAGYDTFSVDFKLRELFNGYEQLVIQRGLIGTVPEPGPVFLLGTALLGLGLAAWRRSRRK